MFTDPLSALPYDNGVKEWPLVNRVMVHDMKDYPIPQWLRGDGKLG
jgi:hypothetical protein